MFESKNLKLHFLLLLLFLSFLSYPKIMKEIKDNKEKKELNKKVDLICEKSSFKNKIDYCSCKEKVYNIYKEKTIISGE